MATVIPETETQFGANLTRIVANPSYRGHNAAGCPSSWPPSPRPPPRERTHFRAPPRRVHPAALCPRTSRLTARTEPPLLERAACQPLTLPPYGNTPIVPITQR